jgi:hypothetical protein
MSYSSAQPPQAGYLRAEYVQAEYMQAEYVQEDHAKVEHLATGFPNANYNYNPFEPIADTPATNHYFPGTGHGYRAYLPPLARPSSLPLAPPALADIGSGMHFNIYEDDGSRLSTTGKINEKEECFSSYDTWTDSKSCAPRPRVLVRLIPPSRPPRANYVSNAVRDRDMKFNRILYNSSICRLFQK